MTMLTLSLLGPFQAALDEQPLTQFRTNKVQALLVYLVAEADTVHKREALMTLLWPGLPLASARTNLRQIMYQLRKAIPELDAAAGDGQVPFLLTEKQNVQANPEAAVELDVSEFSRLLHKSQTHDHAALLNCHECSTWLEEAVAIYNGVFLADFYLADSNLFENWAQAKREAYQRQMVDALNILTNMHMKPGNYSQAQSFARRQLEIDNLNERATRQLMEALARNGQRNEALAVYDGCRQRLQHEIGMAPTAKTTTLYQQILENELGLEIARTPEVRGYELLEEIGRGAFGVVHRAYQNVIGREVAVKIFQPKYANDPRFIRNFDAEAQITARLEHPHIVPLYDFWREPDNAYLVMRWMRGGSLLAALEEGPWPLVAAVTLIDQLSSALHVTHSQGIIHRDIKPSNILLDEEGNAYLSDFSVARDLIIKERQAINTEILGSVGYVSPEQILNEELSSQTDQYSLGVVLYELLTGRRPFSDKSIKEMMQIQINEPLPLVSEQIAGIPITVDYVIQKATAKQAQDRYPDILTFAAAFREVAATGLEPSVSTYTTPLVIDVPNPYKGLRAFQEGDADLFFGREGLVKRLVNHLANTRFLAVIGPSGSGKSSVVRAGLLPAIRSGALPGSEKWFLAEMSPGIYPLEELEAALFQVAVNPPPSLLDPLQKDERGLARTLKRILPVDQRAEGPSQLLLVIDQFEELFILLPDAGSRQHFLQNLLEAINEPRSLLRVIVTLRADFYDRPLQVPELGELLQQHSEIVLPLSHAELEQAIAGPAARVGAQLEPGLAADIIADVAGQPGALPLMQYALTELFDRRAGHIMNRGAYQEIGGIAGALSLRAEEIYQGLNDQDQEVSRQLFLRLVTLGEGTKDTRRRIQLAELETLLSGGQEGSLLTGGGSPVDEFGRFRLLTFDRDPISRAPTVEIAHESLISEWPRLAGWLEESRDDVRQQRALAAATADWLAAEGDESFLLRGGRLDQFRGWAESSTISLTFDEKEFLAASLRLRSARQEEEEKRQKRELETTRQLAETERNRAEEQTRAAQRLRRRAYFLIGMLVVAALFALTAIINGNRATQNANQARDNLALAVSREAEAVANFNLAATQERLAHANADLAGTREAEAQENGFIAATRRAEAESEAWARATAETEAIIEREAVQQQANLATSREIALAALNNLDEDPELSILLALEALEYSHTKDAEEALHQGLQTSRVVQTLTGHTDGVSSSAYSPDGSLIATAGIDSTVRIWQPDSGRLVYTLPFEGIDFAGVTLDFDDSGSHVALIAVGDGFNSAILHIWNVETGELEIQQELAIKVENFSLALSPDWQWIAAGHEDGTAELWDVAANEMVRTFNGHNDIVSGIDISSDNSQLALTSEDGQVTIWDMEEAIANENSLPLVSFNSDKEGDLLRAFFSNAGAYLALNFGGPNEVEIWDLADTTQPLSSIAGHVNLIFHVGFHPDDSLIVTGSADGTAKVWDPLSGEELFTLSGHKAFVVRPTFSPDGNYLVTPSYDGTVRIWNAQPQIGGELFTFPAAPLIFDLKLSPNEDMVALGTLGPATLWETATGKHLHTLAGTAETAVGRTSFHPDGSRIATVGEDGLVRIWDTNSGELLLDFIGHTEGVTGAIFSGTLDVSYSPDGKRLATAGADGLAKVWDAETGQALLTLTGHSTGLASLAYSPDGKLIATSGDVPDPVIKVWDAQTGAEIYTLGPNPGRAWGLSFSQDSEKLGAGGQSGYIKVWDMSNGQEIANMTGQSSTISTVLFAQDGNSLISASGESISIWDIASGTETLNLTPANTGEIALSEDGKRLFSAVADWSAVGIFTLYLDDAVALAQERVTRSLTDDECRQYLHIEECS